MSNEVNLVAGVGGVGRDVRDLPPGLILVTPTTRNAALNTVCPAPFTTPCALGSQPLVANGLAFNKKGDLFNIDTARGALWKIEFDQHGNLKSPTGCDTTFTANTLCLSNIFVAHPILEGGDGIALDREENIWVMPMSGMRSRWLPERGKSLKFSAIRSTYRRQSLLELD